MHHALFGPGGPFGGVTAAPANVDECGNAIPATYQQTKDESGTFSRALPRSSHLRSSPIAIFIACLVNGTKMEKFKQLPLLSSTGTSLASPGRAAKHVFEGSGYMFFGSAFAGDANVFADYLVYVFIVAMAGLAGTQPYLNKGLAMFPALLFVPTYTVLYIVMGTCVGMVFYQEYVDEYAGLGYVLHWLRVHFRCTDYPGDEKRR